MISMFAGNDFAPYRQQAITWTNVDQDACHDVASLGHNELNKPCHRMVDSDKWP